MIKWRKKDRDPSSTLSKKAPFRTNGIEVVILVLISFTSSTLLGYQLGIEAIPESFYHAFKNNPNEHVGFFTNQTGVTQKGERSLDILYRNGVPIKIVFTPEHGLNGTVMAGQTVEDSCDEKTKIPVKSLYKKGTGIMLNQENVTPISTIIVDILEPGMRHFTYVSTLLQLMQVAQKEGKKIIILDRPALLEGVVEGPLVEKEFSSFISLAPVPLRHGLTIGELARYFNAHVLEQPLALEVIPVCHYERTQMNNELVMPLSPYLPTLQSCYGYSFLGLLGEVRPFDVGLGTHYPFRVIGLPESDSFTDKQWIEIACLLSSCGIDSVAHSYYSERKKKRYKGLLLKPKMAQTMHSFKALYYLIAYAKKNGKQINFSDQFDKSMGTQAFRLSIEGSVSYKEFEQSIQKGLTRFLEQVSPHLLYGPLTIHAELDLHKPAANVINK